MKTTAGAVLVTGASTGIGQAIVHDLVASGVTVFAGVRDPASLDDNPLIRPVVLDITNADQVAAAVDQIRAEVGPHGLHGLVNNAGIAIGGPLEFVELSKMRRQFEVNVFGHLAVTQGFLALLREHGGGRIVFTSSIGSRVASPYIGPYAASKHALNGMAGSLRHELRPWNIGVSLLEPAAVTTPIWDKAGAAIEELTASLPPAAFGLYGTDIEAMAGFIGDANTGGIPPSDVARAAHHALYSSRPKEHYLIGREAKIMHAASSVLPTRVFDRAVDKQLRRG